MEWSNDEVIRLIDAYRHRPVLWDPTNGQFKVARRKNEAWNEIGLIFKVDAAIVKSKMLSLLSSFRRERHKERILARFRDVRGETPKPRWFAFTSMLFLMDKFLHNKNYHGVNDEDMRNDVVVGRSRASPDDDDDEESIPETMTRRPKPKTFLFPNKRRGVMAAKRKRPTTAEGGAAERVRLLDTGVVDNTSTRRRDENDVFGELVAHKLRVYDVDTRNIVQHLVNNVLFEADMGKYDRKRGSSMLSTRPHPRWGDTGPLSSPARPSSPQSTQEDNKCAIRYLVVDNNATASSSSPGDTFRFIKQENNFTD